MKGINLLLSSYSDRFLFTILLILYLFPGSLVGYLIYGDFIRQPNLIDNPIGSSLNHLIAFFFVGFFGLLDGLKNNKINQSFIFLILISIFLELLHFLIPNRSFQLTDLISNSIGIVISYLIIYIYQIWKKNY